MIFLYFQPVCLGLNRSDYMFDCEVPPEQLLNSQVDVSNTKLRQIEFNTIASSFGGLCTQLNKCHRFVKSYIFTLSTYQKLFRKVQH